MKRRSLNALSLNWPRGGNFTQIHNIFGSIYYILNIIYLSNVELTLRSNQNISGKLIQCNLLGEVKVLRKSEETYSILRFASP